MPKKIHAGIVEVCVAKLLNYRVYTIVPNVSFGLGLNHECDMLALDKQGRFTEIEIKVSAGDLKADFKKWHEHKSKYISRLVYAMPLELCEKHKDLIPVHCGIIAVKLTGAYEKMGAIYKGHYEAQWFRQCKHNRDKVKPEPERILKFMSLGCMRIWDLKRHNNKEFKP